MPKKKVLLDLQFWDMRKYGQSTILIVNRLEFYTGVPAIGA
jgi:hypothetical protein